MKRNDSRYIVELPSGSLRNPQFPIAGVDLYINDVVYIKDGTVFPMMDDSETIYGVVAAKGKKGKQVLVAT